MTSGKEAYPDNREVFKVKRICRLFSTLFVSLALILALLLAGVRLLGLSPYAVISGSMAPAYPVGSLIYVAPAVFEDVRVGDPITFRLNGGASVATHRVVKIDESKMAFYTKGDANESADGTPVMADDLIGRPVCCIPVLGYIAGFVSAPAGIAAAVGAAAIYLVLSAISAILKKAGKQAPLRSSKRQTHGGKAEING